MRARRGVVCGLAGGDELDQRLGGDVAVADEQAVDVEHGVQQVLVVAGEDLQVGRGLRSTGISVYQRRMLRTPFLVANTPSCAAISSWVSQVVGGLGVVRVLEQDASAGRTPADRPVAVLRGAVLVAETQPAVRRVDQGGGRAGGRRPWPLRAATLVPSPVMPAMIGTASPTASTKVSMSLRLLVVGQEGALTGVSEDDQALHPLDRDQPLRQVGVGGIVDLAVAIKDGDRGGVEPAQVHNAHLEFLSRATSWWVRTAAGTIPGTFPLYIRIGAGQARPQRVAEERRTEGWRRDQTIPAA